MIRNLSKQDEYHVKRRDLSGLVELLQQSG